MARYRGHANTAVLFSYLSLKERVFRRIIRIRAGVYEALGFSRGI